MPNRENGVATPDSNYPEGTKIVPWSLSPKDTVKVVFPSAPTSELTAAQIEDREFSDPNNIRHIADKDLWTKILRRGEEQQAALHHTILNTDSTDPVMPQIRRKMELIQELQSCLRNLLDPDAPSST